MNKLIVLLFLILLAFTAEDVSEDDIQENEES